MKSSQTHNENKKEIDKHISDKKKARDHEAPVIKRGPWTK